MDINKWQLVWILRSAAVSELHVQYLARIDALSVAEKIAMSAAMLHWVRQTIGRQLVAELGAAMTCAVLQVQGELRHASYVESWLKVLKADARAIITAASLASKATDYLRGFSQPTQQAA